MIEAVLFDLDGTLLTNDMHRFMQRYLSALSTRFAHLMPPEQFVKTLLTATEEMVTNRDPAVTNEEAFERAFDNLSEHSLESLRPTIDAYYETEFPNLRVCTEEAPAARPLVEHVIRSGRKAVLATNPLFPMTAIQQRMAWAGVDDLPFALVTSYENMHFCKPHIEYFQEIAEFIQVEPERCLMIGDDVEMDGPAVKAGMRFFWVSDHPPFDMSRGDLDHFFTLVQDGFLNG